MNVVANASRSVHLVTAVVVAGLVLAGCSGGEKKADDEKPSASPTVIDGLTVPGVDLAFGEKATFEWQPTAQVEGELAVTVDEVAKASVKDFAGYELTKEMKASTPYFVTLRATNTGTEDLGGRVLPIYLDTGGETLYPSVETPHFEKCSPRALPKEFPAGESAELCLIFLAPEGTELRSIALWPDGKLEQVDWTGEVVSRAPKATRGSTSGSAKPSGSSSAE